MFPVKPDVKSAGSLCDGNMKQFGFPVNHKRGKERERAWNEQGKHTLSETNVGPSDVG